MVNDDERVLAPLDVFEVCQGRYKSLGASDCCLIHGFLFMLALEKSVDEMVKTMIAYHNENYIKISDEMIKIILDTILYVWNQAPEHTEIANINLLLKKTILAIQSYNRMTPNICFNSAHHQTLLAKVNHRLRQERSVKSLHSLFIVLCM